MLNRVLAVTVLLLIPKVALPQAVTSSIVGTVRDSSGALMAGARVKVTNTGTDLVREVVSDSRGDYVASLLPPGRYKVEVSLASFQTFVVTGITLEMDKEARVDARLEVGQVSQQVTVEASTIFLNSEKAEVGQVIPESMIKELPLNGRNFLDLALISAGVSPSFGTRGTSEAASFSDGRPDVAVHVGGRGDSTSFLIDGVEARSKTGGFVAVPLSVDAIQEFNVKRNNFSAQYGFGESIISVSTKSGTNAFHGALFELLRNDKLDARNFFAPSKGAYRQNQYGAAFGGPIRKNKTFFFGNFESLRIRREDPFVVTVPNPQQMRGNFTGAAPIIDPLSGAPFPNNIIPDNRIANWAKVFAGLWPAPTRATNPNLATTNSFTRDTNQFTTRIDQKISENNQLFGRFIYANDDQSRPEFVHINTANISPIHSRNAAIQDSHVFSPSWVNVLTLGYSYVFRNTVHEQFGQDLTSQLGIVNSGQPPGQFILPQNTILGYDTFGGGGYGFGERENTYQVADYSTVTKGAHVLNFGFETRKNSVASSVIQYTTPSLVFDGSFTKNSVADFVLGFPRSYQAASGVNTNTFKWTQYAAYLADDWKVRSDLTLNIGLRYSYSPPIREINGKTQSFDFSRGVLVISQPLSAGGIDYSVPGIEASYNAQPRAHHYRDFEPRVGFAWRPFGKGSTVVRGAYGIFYTLTQFLEQRQSTTQEPPFYVAISAQSSPVTPQIQLARGDLQPTAAQVFQSGTLQLQAVFDPNDKDPYVQTWNFGIEHRIKDWLLETTYVGKAGVHIGTRVGVNNPVPSTLPNPQSREPYPLFGSILGRFQRQHTSYQAFESRLQRQFTKGFMLLSVYTFSHAIDIESREPSATVVQDIRNLNGSRGDSAYDIRHRFATSGIYDLPFGPSKRYLHARNFASRVVDGWQLNGIISLSTGNHFNVTVTQDIANLGAAYRAVRPNVLRNPNLPKSAQTPSHFFDTSAFVLQPFGQYGNAGRNILTGPGRATVDAGVFKNNYFKENRYNLQFRAEFFNAFNRANFQTPGSAIDGPNFGVITLADSPRLIQFGLRVAF